MDRVSDGYLTFGMREGQEREKEPDYSRRWIGGAAGWHVEQLIPTIFLLQALKVRVRKMVGNLFLHIPPPPPMLSRCTERGLHRSSGT